MKRIFVHLSWLLSVLIVLSACSNQSPDYLKAKSIPPVTPPDDVDKNRLGELFPVPEQKVRSPRTFTVPFPPTIGVQDDANIASVQTFDSELWVLNAKPPATTWLQLINFWQRRNVQVVQQDIASATLETGWFSRAEEPGLAARYRVRMERGLQDNTTEIYLLNQKIKVDDQTTSPNQLPTKIEDPDHANWLAELLVTSLNNSTVGVGNSYLATTINLPQKLRLTEIDQEPVLVIAEKESRLNRALNQALNEKGLSLYESDLSKGVFYFDEYEVRKKSGWLSFFSFNSQGPKKESRYSLQEILDILPKDVDVSALFPDINSRTASKKLSDISGYLLIKRKKQGQIILYVRDGYGKLLNGDDARTLLDTIRLRLI